MNTGCEYTNIVANGKCNEETNNVACYYDGGDCCPHNSNRATTTSSTCATIGNGDCDEHNQILSDNLLQSSTQCVEGWKIQVERFKLSERPYNVEELCDLDGWYGWTSGDVNIGFVRTKLYASTKCVRLDFGNCCKEGGEGFVRVYLNGQLIEEAGPSTPNKIVEFPIPWDPNSVYGFFSSSTSPSTSSSRSSSTSSSTSSSISSSTSSSISSSTS